MKQDTTPVMSGSYPSVTQTAHSASIILGGPQSRAEAKHWIDLAPTGWICTLADEPPSVSQRNLFFAICTALEKSHVEWDGERQSKTDWYDLLLHGYAIVKGIKPKFTIGLEGERLVLGRWSIRNLTKSQVSELIDYATAWATSKGVEVKDGTT